MHARSVSTNRMHCHRVAWLPVNQDMRCTKASPQGEVASWALPVRSSRQLTSCDTGRTSAKRMLEHHLEQAAADSRSQPWLIDSGLQHPQPAVPADSAVKKAIRIPASCRLSARKQAACHNNKRIDVECQRVQLQLKNRAMQLCYLVLGNDMLTVRLRGTSHRFQDNTGINIMRKVQ